uniref:Uncharacterized protein n=1 Tax=Rhizophora mucronata TaxID=61149 RepID=A0A2P2QUV1_RHIMU
MCVGWTLWGLTRNTRGMVIITTR